MKTPIICSDQDGLLYAVPCLICDELIPLGELNDKLQICPKCKKAILYARKLLEDEHAITPA